MKNSNRDTGESLPIGDGSVELIRAAGENKWRFYNVDFGRFSEFFDSRIEAMEAYEAKKLNWTV